MLFFRTIKPLLTGSEYEVSEKAAKDFAARGGPAEKLQALLEDKGSKQENWVGSSAHLSEITSNTIIDMHPATAFRLVARIRIFNLPTTCRGSLQSWPRIPQAGFRFCERTNFLRSQTHRWCLELQNYDRRVIR